MIKRNGLKVAIDARVTPGVSGGVGQAVMSLVSGLARLDDGDEHYTLIVGSEQQRDWLRPFTGPNQSFVTTPASDGLASRARYARNHHPCCDQCEPHTTLSS